MQDLHAEVAELRGSVYQKNAELDSLHRCGHAQTKSSLSKPASQVSDFVLSV